MIQTITIDILNENALRLLQDLELLQLIRFRKEIPKPHKQVNMVAKYKGAMQKQSISDIENQLEDIRNAWE